VKERCIEVVKEVEKEGEEMNQIQLFIMKVEKEYI
jgi:hypothetical protein